LDTRDEVLVQCIVTETKQLSIEFGAGNLYQKLSDINFGLYRYGATRVCMTLKPISKMAHRIQICSCRAYRLFYDVGLLSDISFDVTFAWDIYLQ
jgi:hypothetical protein